MNAVVVWAVLHLLVLHRLDGSDVEINADFVTSLWEARPEDKGKLSSDRVHCIVTMVDSTRVMVEEECSSIKRRMQGERP